MHAYPAHHSTQATSFVKRPTRSAKRKNRRPSEQRFTQWQRWLHLLTILLAQFACLLIGVLEYTQTHNSSVFVTLISIAFRVIPQDNITAYAKKKQRKKAKGERKEK